MTHTVWTEFLTSQSAHWQDGRVTHFGKDEQVAREEKRTTLSAISDKGANILCDLSHYALISASGEDTQSFLQNQFCNDVLNISETQSQLNAYCTPKGRILAFFRLFLRNDCYYLRLPQEILEPTLKRLRMYVMMSKVTLEDASDTLIRIGFAGATAGQILSKHLEKIPTATDEMVNLNPEQDTEAGLSVICLQPGTRFEIIGSAEAVQTLWEKLATEATPVGSGSWELLDIHAAIPDVVTDTQEAFVPQMLNLQAINALSFKKGCYPGQEIVARMHYLGKLKRRMFVVHADEDSSVKPGDTLHAEGSESGQGVGKVVRAQSHPDGGTDLLAVIEISSAEQRTLRLHTADGPRLSLLKLPYTIEEAQ